jgi:hypothetical protein
VVIEIVTFRLAEGADEAAFLEADARVQTEVAPFRPGFVRRTTERNADGEWAVVTLWNSQRDEEDDPVSRAFMSFVDAGTYRVARYTTLD